jgi:hypothetical protein
LPESWCVGENEAGNQNANNEDDIRCR